MGHARCHRRHACRDLRPGLQRAAAGTTVAAGGELRCAGVLRGAARCDSADGRWSVFGGERHDDRRQPGRASRLRRHRRSGLRAGVECPSPLPRHRRMILTSTITCPSCGHREAQTMPVKWVDALPAPAARGDGWAPVITRVAGATGATGPAGATGANGATGATGVANYSGPTLGALPKVGALGPTMLNDSVLSQSGSGLFLASGSSLTL